MGFVPQADWRILEARNSVDLNRPKFLPLSATDQIKFTNSQVLHNKLRVAGAAMPGYVWSSLGEYATNWCGG